MRVCDATYYHASTPYSNYVWHGIDIIANSRTFTPMLFLILSPHLPYIHNFCLTQALSSSLNLQGLFS